MNSRDMDPPSSEAASQLKREHDRTLQAVDESWEYIGAAAAHFREGRYEQSALAYEKAYSISKSIGKGSV